ncbi:MAG: glycosyltransferase family 4 protein [Candidatus Aminicenantales bacterium]
MERLKIAALLPHVEVFGGVRRYLELGNELAAKGHRFVLFHPQGNKPEWLDFRAETRPFSALGEEAFDIGLCGEYSIVPRFDQLSARARFFYFVLEGHKDERRIARRKDLHFLGNSEGICRRLEKKFGLRCHRAPGGINPGIFHPSAESSVRDTFNVLCYGRIIKRRKGVPLVVRAVEKLYRRYPHLRMVFFDTQVGLDRRDPRPLIKTHVPFEFHLNLPQERMSWLYGQADAFVSAERRAGWSNTSAEAMACRVPVVCTPSGTRDFAEDGITALVAPRPAPFLLARRIERLMVDGFLRARLARAGYERIGAFTWTALAERLEIIFASVLVDKS